MTVYKVENVYYTDESLQQYINSKHSFADFIMRALENENGTRDLVNDMFVSWNNDKIDEVKNYLSVFTQLYANYVNQVISSLPRFEVIEGGKSTSTVTVRKNNE